MAQDGAMPSGKAPKLKKLKKESSKIFQKDTSWHLKISVRQLKAILAITRGYHRFASDRLGYDQGDKERMRLMKKAAVEGGLKITYKEIDGHNMFYFYFEKDYYDSTGKNIRGEYCISQWEKAYPDFKIKKDGLRPAIPKGTPTFRAKTNLDWLKKFLKLN